MWNTNELPNELAEAMYTKFQKILGCA